jgi:uncharacterized protein DUF4129
MISSPPQSIYLRVAALPALAALLLVIVAMARPVRAQVISADAGWRDVSVAEYEQHLQKLDGLVSNCQAQHSLKSPAPAGNDACDPKLVGPDDRVQGAVAGDKEPRQVRYDWLRSLLARAGRGGSPAQPPVLRAAPKEETLPPTIEALLGEAHQRLQYDERQVAAPTQPSPSYSAERQTLNSILAQPAYKGISEMSTRERFLEWLDNELDKLLASLIRFGTRSPWIVWTLRIFLILGIGTGLVWALIRIERGARVKLIPEVVPPAARPSAREWQLWLKDAQAMAAEDRWRDAIHFLYWASIARLESGSASRRPWPADRTRTPREYLGLMPGADPRKPSLTALTWSFERTWYGGRAAASGDFSRALELAAELGVRAE